jgi:hypothetical protein
MSICILIYARVFLHHSKFCDRLSGNFISAIYFVVVPAFFLLADQGFRNSVKNHGGFKALWMLLKGMN